MASEVENSGTAESARTVDESVSKLFESPYLIPSPEEPADFSDIGNGHDDVIKASIAEVLEKPPKAGNVDPLDTPFLDA